MSYKSVGDIPDTEETKKAAKHTASNMGCEHLVEGKNTASDILYALCYGLYCTSLVTFDFADGGLTEGAAEAYVLTEFNSWLEEEE